MQIIEKLPVLAERAADSHKGLYGRVLVVAGSVGMGGAAALSGSAALRAGAGLVTVATSKSAQPIVAGFEPAYMTIPLPEDEAGQISDAALDVLIEAVGKSDVVVFGPGLGKSRALELIVRVLIQRAGLRLIIDGDGLNNLCRIKNWPEISRAAIVLTPHPGEFARLWKGLFREPLPADRQQQAQKLAERTGAIIVLKGTSTIVTDAEKVYINSTGNPGMATAGAGDVLAGVIAGLVGQSLSLFEAAELGVYIHGFAGDLAAKKKGQISLVAGDIVKYLSKAFCRYLKDD